MTLNLKLKDDPLISEFMYSVRSERSRNTYLQYLNYFYEYSKLSYAKLLELPTKEIENLLIKYLIHLRDKKLSFNSIKGRASPIITFLELNDRIINKRKIRRYFGEHNKVIKDLAYSSEDLQKMISMSSLRVKVMILIYSSTGIRKSALIDLRLKHLERKEEYGLYKITVYENSKEEYYTFCTPECATAIDQYIEHRKQTGELISQESYLFRNDYDHNHHQRITHPTPVNTFSLTGLLRHLLVTCGMRAPNQARSIRHSKSMFHSFRKYFATTLANSGCSQLVKELLMGHSVGLDNSYYRPTEGKMLNEYLKAVNELTIDSAYKWKAKYEENKIDNEVLAKHEDEIKVILQRLKKRDEMLKELSTKPMSKFRRMALKIATMDNEDKSS